MTEKEKLRPIKIVYWQENEVQKEEKFLFHGFFSCKDSFFVLVENSDGLIKRFEIDHKIINLQFWD